MSTTKFLVEGVYETTCDRCGVPRPPHDWLEWAQLNIYKAGAMGPPPGTVDLCPSCLGILEQQLIGASL